jgi:hypothetical protein
MAEDTIANGWIEFNARCASQPGLHKLLRYTPKGYRFLTKGAEYYKVQVFQLMHFLMWEAST